MIEEFYKQFVLAPANNVANNVVVVWLVHSINILKQELDSSKTY